MFEIPTSIAVVANIALLVAMYLSINLALQRRREANVTQDFGAVDGSVDGRFEFVEADSKGGWQRFGHLLKPSPDSEEYEELVEMLVKAGMRAPGDLNEFFAKRAKVLTAGLIVCALMILLVGANAIFLCAPILGGAFLGPKFLLNSQATARQHAIEDSVPAALDLLEACIEAGLGLEQAVARVAAELGGSEPEIADELGLVVAELRAGMSLGGAFRKLSDRVGADELRTLCSVVIQASSLGAPLSKTLKDYSLNARKRRSLTLEEKAGKITAGLTLPLTICLLPSAILVVLGPAVVMVMEGF
jgi:tight adherence protein C